MKPVKVSQNKSNSVNLGTKKIQEYTSPIKLMSVAYMTVSGRHPEKGFLLESECNFCIYITKGTGKMYAGLDEFKVGVGDVVYVPKNNKFACEGNMEYVTFDTPGYYSEQSKIVIK